MKFGVLTLFLILVSSAFGAPAKVIEIIDGDTFRIDSGDKVRMIGINTPEKNDIYFPESSRHLSELILGRIVELQADTIAKDRDPYERLLRYVFVNGSDINKQMILDGFADAYLKYRFDPQKENDYRQAQVTAQQNQNGKWGAGRRREGNTNQTPSPETKAQTEGYISGLPKIIFIGVVVLILVSIGVYYYRKP